MSKDPDKTKLKEFSNIQFRRANKIQYQSTSTFRSLFRPTYLSFRRTNPNPIPAYAVKSDDSNQTIQTLQKQKIQHPPNRFQNSLTGKTKKNRPVEDQRTLS